MTIWLDAIAENLPGPLHLRVRGRSMLPTLRPDDEVIVHPVTAEALLPGDWVVVRSAQGAFLHRYLGQRHGRILTKGDGHMGFDPPWPPDAVVGRVVEAQRDGRCFYRRAAGQLRRERLLTTGYHILGDVWGVLRRVKALLLVLLAVTLAVTVVWAAVTLTSFTTKGSTECGADTEVCVVLNWETASETDNLGWRLLRSLTERNGYTDISGFIDTLDLGAGASYIFTDTKVIPGTTYYYRLQDLPADGTQDSYTDPISATVPLTPTLTPTPTITPTLSPTSTPNPNVRFWADKTDLTAGECATLYWETNNIRAVYFDGMEIHDGFYGERAFCPCATETHTLLVRYLNGEDEPFVITLNVTGQCGVATATATSTPVPQGTVSNGATATPRPTFTPGPTLSPIASTATPSAEVYVPTATAPAAMPVAQDEAQPAEPLASPLATLPASSESQVGSTATSSLPPTRPPVTGEPSGVPVDDLLSAWLLIIGGIVGAGFIGAGILMWKRQQ